MIDFGPCLGIAFKLGIEASAIPGAPCPELRALINSYIGVLFWLAFEVVSVDIAIALLPLPRAGCVESGTDGVYLSLASKIVAPVMFFDHVGAFSFNQSTGH